jgi:hypothetical protein
MIFPSSVTRASLIDLDNIFPSRLVNLPALIAILIFSSRLGRARLRLLCDTGQQRIESNRLFISYARKLSYTVVYAMLYSTILSRTLSVGTTIGTGGAIYYIGSIAVSIDG